MTTTLSGDDERGDAAARLVRRNQRRTRSKSEQTERVRMVRVDVSLRCTETCLGYSVLLVFFWGPFDERFGAKKKLIRLCNPSTPASLNHHDPRSTTGRHLCHVTSLHASTFVHVCTRRNDSLLPVLERYISRDKCDGDFDLTS